YLLAEIAAVGYEVLLEDRFERGARRRGRHRVAAVTRRAAARIGPRLRKGDFIADEQAAHGKPAAESLAHAHDVRDDPFVLDAPHLARAAEARDHLVGNEQRIQLVSELAQRLQESNGRYDVAGCPLDRLDDDGGNVARRFQLDLLAQEIDARPVARREVFLERAARAGGVG